MNLTVLQGDWIDQLRTLPDASMQCCVTSPPYWQKRDYGGGASQLGAEASPEQYVENLVTGLEEVRRCLRASGSLWLNIGDSYAAGGNGGGGSCSKKRGQWRAIINRRGWRKAPQGYKNKDLTLLPLLVAAACREEGWYLRSSIIWSRPTANEPNREDRPAVSHEYLFLLTKSEDSSVRNPGGGWWSKSVWEICQSPGIEGHPAPMPTELAARCILAGSRPGDTILDPFGGSGTTGMVAIELGRKAILCELNPAYLPLIQQRCDVTPGLAL